MKSLEWVSAVQDNEEFAVEPLGMQNQSVGLCLPVFSLSPCLCSFSSLLGSQLALFLWPFDLPERVWSFKVLLCPLSGVALFLPSCLGFQSSGSLVLWLSESGGSVGRQRRVEVRLEEDRSVMLSGHDWPSSLQNHSSHHTQPLVATDKTWRERWVYAGKTYSLLFFY